VGHVGGARGGDRGDDGRDGPAGRRLARDLDAADLRQGVPRRAAQHAPAVEDGARPAVDGAHRRGPVAGPSGLRARDEPRGRQVPGHRGGGGRGVQLAPLRGRRLLRQDRGRPRGDRHGHLRHPRSHAGADVRRGADHGHQPARVRGPRAAQRALPARHGHHHGGRGQGQGLQAQPQAGAGGLGGGRRRPRGDRREPGLRPRVRAPGGRHHPARRHPRAGRSQGLRPGGDGAHPGGHARGRVLLAAAQPHPARLRSAQHRPLLHGHRPGRVPRRRRVRGGPRRRDRRAARGEAGGSGAAGAGGGRSGAADPGGAARAGRPGSGRPDGAAPRGGGARGGWCWCCSALGPVGHPSPSPPGGRG